MKSKFQILTLLAVISLVAGVAFAQGPGRGGGMGSGMGNGMGYGMGSGMGCDFGPGPMRGQRGGGMQAMCLRLDLSDEQTAQIEKLHEDAWAEMLEVRKEMMRLRNEMQGEMLKDGVSEKIVLGLVEKIGKLRTQVQANRMSTRLAVRELLTPEQRDQMMAMGMNRGGRGVGYGGCWGAGEAGGRGFRGHGRPGNYRMGSGRPGFGK